MRWGASIKAKTEARESTKTISSTGEPVRSRIRVGNSVVDWDIVDSFGLGVGRRLPADK
jgi:hypothetical protein